MKVKLAALIFAPLFIAPSFASENVNVTILGTSDLHGRFIPWDYSTDKPNPKGSLSQIASKVKEIRNTEKNVILVDAGDAIQGNGIETFKHEPVNPMMLGFNALHYDAWVLGNHEFDFGLDALNNAFNTFNDTPLAGNIFHDDKRRFLPAYKIVERDGIKIGIIGMDTPMVEHFAKGSDRINGINFTNPSLEVKKVIAEIKDKVDALVLVAHMGIDNENNIADTSVGDIARANPELDAIVAGHMHVKIDKVVINGVIITEPYKYGRALSRIDLTFTRQDNGKVNLINKNSFTYNMNNQVSDKQLETIFSPYHQKLRDNANRVIGTLSGETLTPKNRINGIPETQLHDTGLTSLFQDVGFHFAPQANVIAIHLDNMNPKMDLGAVTAKDIAYNYEYAGGEYTVYAMTGQDLKKYMEWSAGYFNQTHDGDLTYSFDEKRRSSKYSTHDMFGGVTYKIDLRQPAGKRIVELAMNGKPVTDKTVIHIGMNAYRMGHLTKKGGVLEGRTFTVLSDSKAEYGEEAGTIRNLTIRYISEVKKGKIIGKAENDWSVIGLTGHHAEREIARKQVNEGELALPTTPDGRYTNVKSIRIADLK
ncbi:2',3'-cyclic-nucleotide 2'-phosphodiesterase [Moritella sp. JT01]|uniref:bifunctional metallophosphatase/5'-nucleotidase n=1 Tax=Moritella sp. JT01 TaxID=756698 RepID=UPI0007930592|nr:metallophosphoesterase [Moritella sp. JT01]KXO12585.1 2',3'-cyclic-nucleotide 2'-phosphodiesterase [Moritella sp. JT01]